MSEKAESPKVMLIKQPGVWRSIVSDTYTFAILFALPWFNHALAGGSGWVDFAIACAWFVTLTSRVGRSYKEALKTPSEARAWLDENYPADNQPKERAA